MALGSLTRTGTNRVSVEDYPKPLITKDAMEVGMSSVFVAVVLNLIVANAKGAIIKSSLRRFHASSSLHL